MDAARCEDVGRVMRSERAPAARALLVDRVHSIVAATLPDAAALLDASTAIDWTDPDQRSAHLARATALVEEWLDRGDIEAAIAVQQVVALCDPRVTSPETLAAAVVETAAVAHSVVTLGVHDGQVTDAWELETLDALLALG